MLNLPQPLRHLNIDFILGIENRNATFSFDDVLLKNDMELTEIYI